MNVSNDASTEKKNRCLSSLISSKIYPLKSFIYSIGYYALISNVAVNGIYSWPLFDGEFSQS